MHMRGEPRTMQQNPDYVDVVAEVTQFLTERVAQCRAAGLGEDLIVVDPGFGFGKTASHNFRLLARLRQFCAIGRPLLVGISRKSSLAIVTGRETGDLLPASIAAAVLAVLNGAQIVRVHDVAATVDAMKVVSAVSNSEGD